VQTFICPLQFQVVELFAELSPRSLEQGAQTGDTPLTLAVRLGDENLTRLLVQSGVSPRLANTDNEDAVDIARHQRNRKLCQLLEQSPLYGYPIYAAESHGPSAPKSRLLGDGRSCSPLGGQGSPLVGGVDAGSRGSPLAGVGVGHVDTGGQASPLVALPTVDGASGGGQVTEMQRRPSQVTLTKRRVPIASSDLSQ